MFKFRKTLRVIQIFFVFLKQIAYYLTDKLSLSPKASFFRRIRLAFEGLGPTFIKFGQLISMNPGIFPKELVEEFKKCQDAVPPFPFEEVKEILKAELGKAGEKEFSTLGSQPIAAASIAQVHGATLKDGTEVVVKIQRPGIKEIIDLDIEIMYLLAKSWVRIWPKFRAANPSGLVKNFADTIHQELDFVKEGEHTEKFAELFKDDEEILVPKVYWKLTTGKVLTLERLFGIRINEVEELKEAGVNLANIARIGMEVLIKSAFKHGFFHGDMHAGNVIISPQERYGLIDFGIVGRLNGSLREDILTLLYSIYREDFQEASRVLRKILQGEHVSMEEFIKDVERVGRRYLVRTLKESNWMKFLSETLDATNKYRLKLPFALVLIFKQLLYLDGLGRMMDPNYDLLKDGRLFFPPK